MNRSTVVVLVAIACALAGTACAKTHHEGALARIEAASAGAETGIGADTEIALLAFEHVRGLDSVVVRWESAPAFAVQTRRDALEHYPCVNCHRGVEPPLPADLAAAGVTAGETFAHGTITLRHAPGSVMVCETCHDKRDRSRLVTTTGETVPIDRSSELCRSCHFRQFSDWVGGAHGKRIATWAGPRVIVPCVQCHDPHAPAIGSRWPVAYPRLDRRTAP